MEKDGKPRKNAPYRALPLPAPARGDRRHPARPGGTLLPPKYLRQFRVPARQRARPGFDTTRRSRCGGRSPAPRWGWRTGGRELRTPEALPGYRKAA